LAYRVADRNKTAEFFQEAFGYKVGDEFDLVFDDGSTTRCIALVPPEKVTDGVNYQNKPVTPPWTYSPLLYHHQSRCLQEYHMPPEIFVSDGDPDSIVGKWVAERGGIGGVHHLAYQVNQIETVIQRFRELGIEFLSDEPMFCPDDKLIQIFTKPIDYMGGVVVELIERGDKGFCKSNVKDLMNSTKDCDSGKKA